MNDLHSLNRYWVAAEAAYRLPAREPALPTDVHPRRRRRLGVRRHRRAA